MDEKNSVPKNQTDSEYPEREEQINVNQDLQESQKEDASIFSEKVEAVNDEKENSSEEAGDPEKEVSVTEDHVEQVQFSCSYEPPYHTPLFSTEEAPASKQKKTKKKTKALIAILIAIGIVITFVGGVLLGPLLFEGQSSFPIPPGTGTQQDEKKVYSSFAEVVDAVAASVVEIDVSMPGNTVFGSGVIIDGDGYIITNQHVVEDFTKIIVRLRNGTEYEALYIGGDSKYDIAVLKINPVPDSELVVASIGQSSDVKVGEEVLAIGNPLGLLGGTVTNGIISAKNRKIRTNFYPMTFLQTNAQISQGNSGGALFNMSGELIGIVNAKVIDAESGAEGLGFAIPIDVAWRCAKDLMEYGYVTGEPDIGFSIAVGTPGFGYPTGIYIIESQNESLQVNDRIVEINGTSVESIEDIYDVTDQIKIGDKFELKVARKGVTDLISVSITVTEYKP